MTIQNDFVDKVVLSLVGKLSDKDIKLVKDALINALGNYEVTRACTEVVVSGYELPDCYKMYIAAKTMNGEFSSKGTIKLYKDVLEKMLYTFAVPVDQITTNMLRGYFAKMQTTPSVLTGKVPSNNTINNRKCIVRSFFQWLTEEEYISKDVSARIKGERIDLKPEPVFTDMELERMRAACKKKPPNGWKFSKYRDLAIVDVLSSTGVRVKELCDINIEDVNLDERKIVVFGKGNKYRTVYFDVRTEFSIRRYLKETGRKTGALFVTKRKPHSRLGTDDVRNLLNAISERTGIIDIHPHRFRHTLATKLVEKGCDIYYVKEILGHSSIETTLRYVHTSEIKVKNSYDRYF